MNNQVEFLLEDDHASLGQLLSEVNAELAKRNIARAFALLDIFWARLAVHIRAENLHLFPALASAPATSFTKTSSPPTAEEVKNVLARLRSDHDFFMKELGRMIKVMRTLAVSQEDHFEEVENLRQSLAKIASRLEEHNRLEETQAYRWPKLLLDEQELDRLCVCLRQELQNLPPRFAAVTLRSERGQ
jgi:AmiR/NasT family two-component response regulator